MCRHSIDEIEPAFNAVEPSIDIVEPLLNGGVIQFDAGYLALQSAEPRHNLVELVLDAFETIVEPREANTQKVENVTSFAHTWSSITPACWCQSGTADAKWSDGVRDHLADEASFVSSAGLRVGGAATA